MNKNEWIIVFGGAGRETCIEKLVSCGLNVKYIFVPKVRNKKLETAVRFLKELHNNVVEVTKEDVPSTLRMHEGKSLLSIGFPYLIPSEVLSLFSPALNVHPTLLPRYRGPTTGAYILINNESKSGSTVHYMTEEMDKGDIIMQSEVPVTPFDTIRSLQRKVYSSEPDLILKALSYLNRNGAALPQDEGNASEYKKLRVPADSQIDPSLPLAELFDQIRACDPDEFPAFFMYCGEKVCIKLWRPNKPSDEFDLI